MAQIPIVFTLMFNSASGASYDEETLTINHDSDLMDISSYEEVFIARFVAKTKLHKIITHAQSVGIDLQKTSLGMKKVQFIS